MLAARPVAWTLAGLTLFPLGAVSHGQGDGQGKKKKVREPAPSLVELPEGFVRVARVPDGGTCPRLATGKEGAVALLYYKGDATHGDLYLARSADDAATFSPSVRLNAEEGSVAAFRGDHSGAVAMGPDGLAHAVWITTGASPKVLHVREKSEGGLEPVQELAAPTDPAVSSAIALAATGEAYVFYAAFAPSIGDGFAPESRVWMQKSLDGNTFGSAVPVDEDNTHVSMRSRLAAHVDAVMGTVFVLYRAGFVSGEDNRLQCNLRLLASEDRGATFQSSIVDFGGRIEPQSSASLTQERNTTVAAWDNRGQAFWSVIRRAKNKVGTPSNPRPSEHNSWRRQVVSATSDQEVMLVWLERPDKDTPADVAPTLGWQLWMKEPLSFLAQGRIAEIPPGTTPAVIPRSGSGFTILY